MDFVVPPPMGDIWRARVIGSSVQKQRDSGLADIVISGIIGREVQSQRDTAGQIIAAAESQAQVDFARQQILGYEAQPQLTVGKPVPNIDSYPNGYRKRRTVIVPAIAGGATLSFVPVPFIIPSGIAAYQALITKSDGTALSSDPVNASVVYGLLESINLSAKSKFYAYFDRAAGDDTSGQVDVWARSHKALRLSATPVDLKTGTSLATGTVATDALGPFPAARFNGATSGGYIDAGAVSISAVSQLSIQCLVQSTAAPLSQGIACVTSAAFSNTTADYDLSLRFDTGRPRFYIKTSAGTVSLRCNDAITDVNPHHIAVTWVKGNLPRIYVDGVEKETTLVNEVTNGRTGTFSSTKTLFVGFGVDSHTAGGLNGKVAELNLSISEAWSPERIAFLAQAYINPTFAYGYGDVQLCSETASTASPVAVPVSFTGKNVGGPAFDIDVLGASENESGASCSVALVGAPTGGTATLSGNAINYTPPTTGGAGRYTGQYKLTANLKTSTSTYAIDVSAAATSEWSAYTGFALTSYATQWQLFNPTAGTVTQLASGVRVNQPTASKDTWLVSKEKVDPVKDIKVEFDYTIHDNNANAGGTFFGLGFVRGDGTAGFPADVATWTGWTDDSPETKLGTHGDGWRLTMANRVASSPAIENEYRIVLYTEGTRYAPGDATYTGDPNIVLNRNIKYHCVLIYRHAEASAQLTVTDPTGASQSGTHTVTGIALTGGTYNMMLRTFGGRDGSIENFVAYSGSAVSGITLPSEDLSNATTEIAVGVGCTTAAQFTTSLKNALTNVKPGHKLVLENGTYAGDFSVEVKTTTATNGIVIKAKNKGGAILTGRLTVKCPWVTVWGIDFTANADLTSLGALTISSTADDCRVIRCRFNNFTGPKATFIDGSDNRVGTIQIAVTGKRPIFLFCTLSNSWGRGISFDTGCVNPQIHRCDFSNWTYAVADEQTHECVQLGTGKDTTNLELGGLISECRFVNMNNGNKENETVSIKSCGNTIQFCYLEGARTITNRHGVGNTIKGCSILAMTGKKDPGLRVYDGLAGRENLILGNYVEGSASSNGGMMAACGNALHGEITAVGGYRPVTVGARFYGNVGDILVAEKSTTAALATKKATGIKIRNNDRAPTLVAGTYDVDTLDNKWQDPSPIPVPTRYIIAATKVGWNGVA